MALVALTLISCTTPPPSKTPEPRAPTWESVRPGEDVASQAAPARVLASPTARALVTAPLRATVVRVRVQAGDAVAAGAPLVDVLMPDALQAAGRAEGARVRLAAWTERQQQLTALRADGLARNLEVSEAAARVAEAKADLQSARAVLLSAGVREADALLTGGGAFSLRAPMAGVVVAVSAVAGESREPGGGALVELAGEGPVRVEARFTRPPPDGDYTFSVGSRAVPVRLVSRSPLADPRDGTTVAWLEALDGGLTAGALGRVSHPGGTSGGFRVPSLAVRRVDGEAQVETRRGPVPVEVTRCELEDCLVQGALTADDQVQVGARP